MTSDDFEVQYDLSSGTDTLSMRLPHTSPAADTANMLAPKPDHTARVSDTRKKSPIYVNWKTGQLIGRSRPIVAGPLLALRMAGLLVCLSVYWGCRSSDAPPAPGTGSTPARGGELLATIRSEPATYNRYVPAGASAATDVVTFLTQARLVRVNRATDELEPWLAEGWTVSADNQAYTITIRPDLKFSDGQPMTSADVLFSFRAAYDPGVGSLLGSALSVHGKPLDVTAPDARTVVVKFPQPFAPGLRLLDSLPILPKHTLGAALDAGQFQTALGSVTPGQRGRRPRAVSARRARGRAAARVRAQPALLPARRGRRPAAVPRSADARNRARSERRSAPARSGRERPDDATATSARRITPPSGASPTRASCA